MLTQIKTLATRFRKDEAGLALTEYLILLGLLTGAVIAAVILFGDQLGVNWTSWGAWMDAADLEAPATTTTTTTSG